MDTPNRVSPGEGYEVDVKVSNGAAFINPLDPDSCGDTDPGYKLRVVLEGPNGQTYTRGPTCHLAALVATGDETYTFELQAPEQSGEHEVSAHVEMVGSGKATGSETSRFLVDANESEQATDPGGNGGDDLPAYGDADGDGTPNFLDEAPNDPDVPGGGLGIGGQMDKLLLVAGLLAVAWLASSGAEVVS
ncbi:hypothetical protein [Halolamina litorea]|uniref:PGF-CTERM protein n=1 Tax=Halolamina litorea TaxID=1515593 RepID=A0ABD6BMN2_9EURY|nr:hypothetical protein [Halolamina litorea]